MKRLPYNLPEPLMSGLRLRGFSPLFVVPSAIGLPAESGLTQQEWEAEQA